MLEKIEPLRNGLPVVRFLLVVVIGAMAVPVGGKVQSAITVPNNSWGTAIAPSAIANEILN